MAKTVRKLSRGTPKHRASWKGPFTFGLVSFSVEAFNALDKEHSDIHFHQIHAVCHSRIHYQKVCPIHGEVSNKEIVSGYEFKKGKYVEVEPEELEALRTKSERALRIDAFVSPDAIDPIYCDGRMYYLVPAGAASVEPYAVVVEAMEREECYAVGQVVFSGRDQMVLVRPLEGILNMAMLNYQSEIRDPKKMLGSIKKPTAMSREVGLAQTLIKEWSQSDFDFSKYQDHYREKVKELIEAKVHGREIAPMKEEEPAATLSLMDALKRSVENMEPSRNGKKRSRRHSA